MVTYSINHRAVVLLATNQTASIVPYGTVVVVDTAHDQSFVTTTTQGHRGALGIAQNQIGPGSQGRVVTSGYSGTVLVTGAVTRGHFGRTSTTAGKAEDMGATRGPGAFCQFLTDGDVDSPPRALLFGYPDSDGGPEGEPGPEGPPGPGVADFKGARVFATAVQELVSGDYTTLEFDDVEEDEGGYWDAGEPTRLTVPVGCAGPHLIFGAACVEEASGGQRVVVLRRNGGPDHANILVATSEPNPGAAGADHENLSTVRWLDEGDYVELRVYQNSGGTLDSVISSTTGDYLPSMGLALLRGAAGEQGPAGDDGLGVPAGGTTGQVLAKASGADNDTEWVDPEGGGATGQGLRDFEMAKRTSGNVTCNSTTWANFDTGLDLVLSASTGDTIEVGISGWWSNESVYCGLDVATIVSAAPVNYVSGGAGGATTFGVMAWIGTDGVQPPVGGSVLYELVSGDISGGTVTLRIRYRTSAGSNKVMRANIDNPFHWFAKNLGPAL